MHSIVVANGELFDRLNIEQACRGLAPVDFEGFSRWLELQGANPKFYIPGEASTISAAILRNNQWRIKYPSRPYPGQRSPVEGTVLEVLLAKKSQSGMLQGFETIIFAGTGDEYAKVLEDVLAFELELVVVARADLLSPGLRRLLRHPLAQFCDLRSDLGVAV